MKAHRQRQILTGASVSALVALVLVVWSVVDPRPVPVVLAMSVAQGLGTLSLLAYLLVVLNDLRKARVLVLGVPAEDAPATGAATATAATAATPAPATAAAPATPATAAATPPASAPPPREEEPK